MRWSENRIYRDEARAYDPNNSIKLMSNSLPKITKTIKRTVRWLRQKLGLDLVGGELITDTAHGDDALWLTRIILDQGAQARDVDIDGAIDVL